MACLMGNAQGLLVWLVVVIVIVALVRLLVPLMAPVFGSYGGIVAQALNIILWGVVAIAVIYIIFGLLGCIGGPPVFHR